MIGGRRFVQGATANCIARIDPRLVLQQQLHAGRIIFIAGRRRQQSRLPAGDFGLCAALQQEPRQAPVTGRAGAAQWRNPFVVAGIHVGPGIAQQGRHAGVGTARGVVQGGVAIGIG